MGFNSTTATCSFENDAHAQAAFDVFENLSKNNKPQGINILKNTVNDLNPKLESVIDSIDTYPLDTIEKNNNDLILSVDFSKRSENDCVVRYIRSVASTLSLKRIFSLTYDDNDGSFHIHTATKDKIQDIYATGSGNSIDESIYNIEWNESKELLHKVLEMYNSDAFSKVNIKQAEKALQEKLKQERSGFNIGDKVKHSKFGNGIVIGSEEEGTSNYRIEVNFDNNDTKWLVVTYAKLKLI